MALLMDRRNTRMKKLMACVLAVLLMLACAAAEGTAQVRGQFILPVEQVQEAPAGYTALYTLEDLRSIADNPQGKYILMADISLKGSDPFPQLIFEGELEGNGHKITGLMVKRDFSGGKSATGGLFYCVNNARVSNLHIEGSIHATGLKKKDTSVVFGGLAAYVFGTTEIHNCVTDVEITTEENRPYWVEGYVGGIGGWFEFYEGGVINYCRNLGKIYVNQYAGGIVGHLELTPYDADEVTAQANRVAIFGCRNDGSIETRKQGAGGIVGLTTEDISGYDDAWKMIIASCANHGEVVGSWQVGGIVGCVEHDEHMLAIRDCYNDGVVAGTDTVVAAGGIIGEGDCLVDGCVNLGNVYANLPGGIYGTTKCGDVHVTDCYYLDIEKSFAGEICGEWVKLPAGMLTAEQMKLQDSFIGLDFADTWVLQDGMTAPYPKALWSEKADDMAARFDQLREMFPDGKYWNHVGVSDADYAADPYKYNSTYTEYPCDAADGSLANRHNHTPCPADGSCGCNSWDGKIQCFGFAYFVGEYLTDAKVGTWDLAWNYSQSMSLIGQFQPGDCIRFGTPGNGHSAIVVDVTKTGITLLEVNFVNKNTGKNCRIDWTEELSWSKISARFADKGHQGTVMRYVP